jgi:hypothetical protein
MPRRCLNLEARPAGGASERGRLIWANVVGRDGIEPPTLRFSVACPGLHQRAGCVMPLVKWHAAEQAWSALGRILVDRDVDHGRPMGGQDLGASEDLSSGGRRRAPFGIEGLRQRLLDDSVVRGPSARSSATLAVCRLPWRSGHGALAVTATVGERLGDRSPLACHRAVDLGGLDRIGVQGAGEPLSRSISAAVANPDVSGRNATANPPRTSDSGSRSDCNASSIE